MFTKILIPVDGSKGSSKALHVAAELAKKFGSKVHVLFVVETPAALYPPGLSYVDLLDNTVKWGKEVTATASKQLAEEGISNVETQVVEGHPAQTILEQIEERAIDLIVMGTHGRRGLDRILLGSVAEEVVRRSKVPVMTVRLRDTS